jgi:hypothetical protein
MMKRAVLIILGVLSLACAAEQEHGPDHATLACVPDSVAMGGGDTLTTGSQLAIYAAVLDSVRNMFGKTALYLDPRIETVGRDLEVTRLHDPALLDYLLASERFADLCQVDDDSRCAVDAPGVNVRFSGLLRATGTERVLLDMTQQTVRPVQDSADWYFWATWVRFWLEQEGRCWHVSATETKGTV